MQKKCLYCLLFVLSSFYITFANAQDTLKTKVTSINLLIFGDSLSAAYNIKREQGWTSLLQDFVDQRQLNINIINASISGETTGGGLKRLPAQLQQHQPDIVILELGGNDGLRGFTLETIRDNLQQMIRLSKQHGAQVILAGIQLPPNYGRTYTTGFADIYWDLSKSEQIALIPFFLKDVGTEKTLMQADGIHPNAIAQPIIMTTVWPYLEKTLQTLAKP